MNKLYSLLLLLTFACNTPQVKENDLNTIENLPEILQEGIAAHGGLEAWKSMRTLEYDVMRDTLLEHHLIDLQNRKVRLTTDVYEVGFDGTEVWVTPNKAAFGKSSARFYHNLRFYFFAMPFLAADPGINYETMLNERLNDKLYDALKISYDSGVGDAPDDEYILYFDQNSHQMEWLLYTVTYFTGEKGKKYNALHYNEWQNINGLQLPKTMAGYTFANDSIGNKRYERVFENAKLSSTPPDQTIFEMPSIAEIDSLQIQQR